MASKRRSDEDYGKGSVVLTSDDIRDAATLGKDPKKDRYDPITRHPLFAGISKGTQERFREKLKRVAVQPGERLTHHAIASGATNPRNRLLLSDEKPLRVDIFALGADPENEHGEVLGTNVELDGSNFGSWFGGATHMAQVRPGLDVRASSKTKAQRAFALPPLPDFFNPDRPDEGILPEDVAQLLDNSGWIFSQFMKGDNQAEVTGLPGFHPHELSGISQREFDALQKLSRTQTRILPVERVFVPDRDAKSPEAVAFILSGRGWFFDRGRVESVGGLSLTPQEIVRAGVNPLAQLGAANNSAPQTAFAFQWAGLNTGKNKADAVFIPSTTDTTLTSIRLGGDLDLRHRVVRSIAETAASMHGHVNAEAARLEAAQPVMNRLAKGFLRLIGRNS